MKLTSRVVVGMLAGVLASGHALAAQAAADGSQTTVSLPADPAIAAALAKVSAERVKADIETLVGFGTRNTLSSMETDLPKGQGINAAADWIAAEFGRISEGCGGCLEVKRDEFVEPAATGPGGRVPKPTKLVNVYAVMHGTGGPSAPWVLVTGHYDSRATDVMNPKLQAPGANDDASGVAVSLESARALAGLKVTGTIVFVAVAGEEQGLDGSRHLAEVAKAQGWPLEAVLNDDIVGGDTTPGAVTGDAGQDKNVVRVFSESVSAAATPVEQKQMLGLGAEGDSPSRELARMVAEVALVYFKPTTERPPALPNGARSMMMRLVPGFHPVLVLRRDRYLRGGDHTSFNGEGFAAVRFTEWRENFDHQHQTVRTENGVEYGDLLKFVDFTYVAKVARLNAATLAMLASAPSEPQHVRILTKDLDNDSELTWDAAAFAPDGTSYEVVWRATNELMWTHSQSAGAATHLKLNVSKDNVLFGVRSVDATGHRSLPVPPLPAR
jgi:hypothetical protein